jgi:hypothetical protein
MTHDNFQQAVQTLVARQPFAPFVLELHGGERFEIDHPNAIAWGGEGAAVFVGPGSVLRIFDSESVLQVINAPAHAVRKKK